MVIFARIEGARKAGARELLGGLPDHQVLPPHVFVGVTNDMAIAQDEIFGPIAPIIKVKDEEEAVHVANQTEYGLSSAVFTRDRERGVRFALRVEAGMTHVVIAGVDRHAHGTPSAARRTVALGGSVGSGSCANLRVITG